MFMDAAESPQEAVKKAMNMVSNQEPMVLFFPQAQRALSVLDSTVAQSNTSIYGT